MRTVPDAILGERFPRVLPMRERAEVIRGMLERRLDDILPLAMREAGLDMWIVLCQEDNLDPVFSTMIPMDTWCPILQILVFHDRGAEGIERINLSMTDTGGLYDRPWNGCHHEEQWPLLVEIVRDRKPERIGVNTGDVQWAAGALTHNLHTRLTECLGPENSARLVSAERAATRWLATLAEEELPVHEHVVNVAHHILAECFSRKAITPGLTTTRDLEWYYWQRASDLGLEMAFKPFFMLVRSDANRERWGADDRAIRPGDFVRSDVGIRYLGLNSDHQEWGYVPTIEDAAPPAGIDDLFREVGRLQSTFMGEFRRGRTGNELLAAILGRARELGISEPRVYSHSLGRYLHEPGPLIGLPWEQERCEGRGDVALEHNYAFTMELSIRGPLPEWGGQKVTMGVEEDVVFTRDGCRPIDGLQTRPYVV